MKNLFCLDTTGLKEIQVNSPVAKSGVKKISFSGLNNFCNFISNFFNLLSTGMQEKVLHAKGFISIFFVNNLKTAEDRQSKIFDFFQFFP